MSNEIATRDDVARLFGRAAFGATGPDINRWTGVPYEQVVGSLFPPEPVTERDPAPDEAVRLRMTVDQNDYTSAGRWWLERMRTTAWPLEERMTLFWHDHFATAWAGLPDVGMLMNQNQKLRVNALGDFRALANAMTTDAAMLFWLNGNASAPPRPNENYAREFLELFTLGTNPQVYTETDIRQAAKAFTGFTVNSITREVTFQPTRHDHGVKVVLGRTIGGYGLNDPREALEYQEVLEAALAADGGVTTSRFVAYKLVLSFGYQPDELALGSDPLVTKVAAALRQSWNIGAAVRTMLLADEWRYAAPAASHQLVRSPVELVVHAAKILGVICDLPANQLASLIPYNAAARMGQTLFRPPNVGGWPNGANWLSNTTNLARYDGLYNMVLAYRNQRRDSVATLPYWGDFETWAWFMGLGRLTPSTLTRMHDFYFGPGTTVDAERQLSTFILMGSSPDWQVM